MIEHSKISDEKLHDLLRAKIINWGGYRKKKIYGTLDCFYGKEKMLKVNRVFFETEEEAISLGYRPCSKCLSEKYKIWKAANK